MSAPNLPNPTANPITDARGNLRPDWVRFLSLLLVYVADLEARIAALESPPP